MISNRHHLKNLDLSDHEFLVPLDHTRSHGPKVKIFARELNLPDDERSTKPWLVFLQGGPGMPAPRPVANTSWWKRALVDYRVLLLDQRGTGRSTPVTAQTLAHIRSVEQAEYLKCFRADSIVRDCELIRAELVGSAKWTVLGQSYGGFCALTYLSIAPEGLAEAIITGGLPALEAHPDDIYRVTYRRVAEANRIYYQRYPKDVDIVADIVRKLRSSPPRLPGGDTLTPRRFRQLGFWLGMSDGPEILHYLLEEAFVRTPAGLELSENFLWNLEHAIPFDTNPIFSILHEACYTQGFASNWSAARVLAEFSQFHDTSEEPFAFTGEMIYPWMFEDYRGLRPFRDAADLLARFESWPHLYDVIRLRENAVPCVAAIYDADLYVPREHSEATARAVKGLRPWITNEYEHNGLRENGDHVLSRLLDMLKGRA